MSLKCALCGWAVPSSQIDPLRSMLAHKTEVHIDKDPRDIVFVSESSK